jgi:mono/diheme cytochrome c family protein
MKTTIKALLVVGSMLCATSALKAAGAAENWSSSCASCHGKDGSGDTTMGKKYGVKNYQDAKAQESFTDEQATKAIVEGVTDDGKTKMKAFKEKLTEAEIKDLVAYIRTLKK